MEAKAWARTKSLDAILKDAEKPEYQLRRALGPWHLTLLGIGAIIGAGIFATPGTAAAGDAQRPGAGPALMVSFLITAVACGFAALCYAEFAAMVPISGSAYTYSYATLGEFVAWVIGWDLIIEYAVGNVAVAISWANYFKTFLAEAFQLHVPHWLSMDYRTAVKTPGVLDSAPQLFGQPIVFNLLAVGIIALITVILIWGIRESARFNAIMVTIKVIVLLFFIGIGFGYVKVENYQPFMPNDWAGVSAGAAVIFFAYIGFDAVSTVAEETKNPQRNLPIGIIASLLICAVFYVVVSAVFTGLISYPELQAKRATEQAEPLTVALQTAITDDTIRQRAVTFVAFGSVIAHTAVLLVFQLGQTRMFMAMSRDGLLPKAFSRVHPRFRTPHYSTLLVGLFVAVVAAFASIDEMVDLTNIGTLFAFILVCTGIMVLRKRDPDRPRPFRVPGGWTLPILGILSCLYLIYYLPETSWLRFTAWLNLGFVVYVGYGSVQSRLTGRHLSDRPATHDAGTAALGAWVALLGTASLFGMRALSVGLSGGDILSPDAWVRISGERGELLFLVVPLVCNALVLCPIVIWRAIRAGRNGATGIGMSLLIASLVILITCFHVGLIFGFQSAAGP